MDDGQKKSSFTTFFRSWIERLIICASAMRFAWDWFYMVLSINSSVLIVLCQLPCCEKNRGIHAWVSVTWHTWPALLRVGLSKRFIIVGLSIGVQTIAVAMIHACNMRAFIMLKILIDITKK